MPKAAHVTFTTHGDPPLRLEGLLHRAKPGVPPAGSCVLLHPHAVFRGSMDTWLLASIAHRLAEDGWTVLRFNFRGVGASEGASGDGTGELHDLLGALTFLDQIAATGGEGEPPSTGGEGEPPSTGGEGEPPSTGGKGEPPSTGGKGEPPNAGGKGEPPSTGGKGDRPRVAVVGWGFGALVGLLLAEHSAKVTDWVGIGPPTRRLNAIPSVDPPYHALPEWPARRCVVVGELDQLYPPRGVAVLDPDIVHVMAGADHFMTDRYDEVAEVVSRALKRDPPISRAHG